MLSAAIEKLTSPKTRHLASLGGGVAALLAGRKRAAASMMAGAMMGLEQEWRAAHPEFEGGLRERFAWSMQFYDETHQHPTNRALHIAGIPVIAASTVGLFVAKPFRPVWLASAGGFTVGWAMNFVGHGVFERSAPAFADDPLGFIAGPVWDMKQLLAGGRSDAAPAAAEAAAT